MSVVEEVPDVDGKEVGEVEGLGLRGGGRLVELLCLLLRPLSFVRLALGDGFSVGAKESVKWEVVASVIAL